MKLEPYSNGIHSGGRTGFLSQLGLRPRIVLFFFAVPTALAASAISGVGSASHNSALLLSGTGIWVLWFGLMFMIAVPRTDRLLENQTGWLRRGALTIFIFLAIFGLFESVAVITIHSWFHPLITQIML